MVFICIKVCEGFALLILSNYSSISHENANNLALLIFIGYLKTGGWEEGSREPH